MKYIEQLEEEERYEEAYEKCLEKFSKKKTKSRSYWEREYTERKKMKKKISL